MVSSVIFKRETYKNFQKFLKIKKCLNFCENINKLLAFGRLAKLNFYEFEKIVIFSTFFASPNRLLHTPPKCHLKLQNDQKCRKKGTPAKRFFNQITAHARKLPLMGADFLTVFRKVFFYGSF